MSGARWRVWYGASMSPRRVAVLAVALLVLGWYFGREACERRPETPEEEIELRIAEVERAAEKKDMGTLRDFVSATYADPHKRKRSDLEAVLLRWVLSQSSIHILTRIRSIAVGETGRGAEVTVAAAMASSPLDSPTLLPSIHADIYLFEATLRKEADAVWRVVAADWRQATVDDFGDGG